MLNRLASNLPSFKLAHISLILVGLMWVLPFLYPYHTNPLTTFYQEWGAALLGLGASVLLLSKDYWIKPEIPRIVLLPIGLMLLALLQFMLGKVVYFDQVLLFTLYMLWVALLMMLGQQLRKEFGMSSLTTILAIFLLLGSELSAVAGIVQHNQWRSFLDYVVTHKNNIAVYGNLAQPNHFANYITLGLISIGLLRNSLRSWHMVLLALPLLYVLVLSGSRSSWLYLLAMATLAFVWQRKNPSYRNLLYYTLWLIVGFALMHGLVQLSWFSGANPNVTPVQRMMAGDTGGNVRLYLWHEAWLMFSQFPLLGVGWGQFAWQHFQFAPELQANHISGLYNNAHNVLLHLAAEMGMAGVLILLLPLGLWFLHGRKQTHTIAHWWSYAVLSVLAIHGLLEYPLWYVYFLGIAAVMLGAMDVSSYRLELSKLGRLSVGVVLILGVVSLLQFQLGYTRLERAITLRPNSAADSTYMQRMREGLIQVYNVPMLQPYAELFMNNFIDVNEQELASKIAMNERSVQFVPISSVVYLRAALLAQDGRLDEAKLQIERAIWAYPGDFLTQKKELESLAQKDSVHFAALLEFAIQKNKEYSSAVSTK